MIRHEFQTITQAQQWLDKQGFEVTNGGYYFEDQFAVLTDSPLGFAVLIKAD